MEAQAIQNLEEWFLSKGGWYHPNLRFEHTPSTGLSLFAASDLPEASVVVEMPRELALSPFVCRNKVLSTFNSEKVKEPDFELPADWIVLFHFLARSLGQKLEQQQASSSPAASTSAEATSSGSSHGSSYAELPLFTHQPYIHALPREILTPTTYSEAELFLLRATPLHGDAIERRGHYRKSLAEAMRWLREIVKQWEGDKGSQGVSAKEGLTQQASLLAEPEREEAAFEEWVWAYAAYSSRAFPPVMILSPDEQVPRSLVGPVLLPGMDIFNHARGVPVTWTYPFLPAVNPSKLATSAHSERDGGDAQRKRGVALELGYRVPAGEQVFNCYGGKSNEEFLCGYGFVLPEGADDQLTLVLGGGKDSSSSSDGSGGVKTERKGVDMHGTMADSDLEATQPTSSASGSNTPITALAVSRPWGSKHYWRIVHPASSEKGGAPAGLLLELRERLVQADRDEAAAAGEEPSAPPRVEASWLLRPHFATPPSPSWEDVEAQEERLEALRLDGEVLEALEGLLCAKRKAFKAVQKEVDALGGVPRGVRPEVFEMVAIYRRGQATILEQAIEWTRAQMDTLVELIDELEDEMDEEAD